MKILLTAALLATSVCVVYAQEPSIASLKSPAAAQTSRAVLSFDCIKTEWAESVVAAAAKYEQIRSSGLDVSYGPWTCRIGLSPEEFFRDGHGMVDPGDGWVAFTEDGRNELAKAHPGRNSYLVRGTIVTTDEIEVMVPAPRFPSPPERNCYVGIDRYVNGKKCLDGECVRLHAGANSIVYHLRGFGGEVRNVQLGLPAKDLPTWFLDAIEPELRARFPVEMDWVDQDLPGPPDLWKNGSLNDDELWGRWLAEGKALDLASAALRRALTFAGGDAAGRDADRVLGGRDPLAILRHYVAICKARRAQRLAPILARTQRVVFTRLHRLGNFVYLITENENMGGPTALCEIDLAPEVGGKSARTGVLLEREGDTLRDPEIAFDGKRMLFSRRSRGKSYHICELDFRDRSIRELTTEATYGASFEPCYLPGGDIIFSSSRIVQVITCGYGEHSNLFLMDKDGRFARRIGFDQTNTAFPVVINDGRVIYTRRDYNDRGQTAAHALFVMNPDGARQTEMYGNQTGLPNSFQHFRPFPDSSLLLGVVGGYHTAQGGKLVVMDVNKGNQGADGLALVPSGGKPPAGGGKDDRYGKQGVLYANPYPVTGRDFLVSISFPAKNSIHRNDTYGIYAMNLDGGRELLSWNREIDLLQPVPVMPRRRPPNIASSVDYRKDSGVYFVQNVYRGVGSAGIAAGDVSFLRVVALHYKAASIGGIWGAGPGGGMDSVTPVGGPLATYDAKTIIGDATVYPDGSAMFEVPARTPVYFQLLDKKRRMIQTMRSWTTLMPNEVFGCVGCHEGKHEVPLAVDTMAAARGVERLREFHGPPRPFDYRQQVQPVFDRHCIRCHRDGGANKSLVLTGEPLPRDVVSKDGPLSFKEFPRSYVELTKARPGSRPEIYVCWGPLWERRGPALADEPNRFISWMTRFETMVPQPPYRAGSLKSGLLNLIEKGHQGITLAEDERERIQAWIDLIIPCFGEYDATLPEQKAELYRQSEKKREEQEAIEQENIRAFIKAGQPCGLLEGAR